MPQELSAKEQSLFRTLVRNYEDKQYKKGAKAADQILRKNPNHGDTIAMKALILNSQGKTEEAFALGKVALKCDMKSHVCWHVYGLLYRTAKNFEEAIKAYKFALKLEPDSQQIQRDLALLQIQMRDYQGYIVSRKAMVQARPGIRGNWTALAIAYHLNGDLAEAERVMTSYEDTLRTPPLKTNVENSEAILYKNSLIAEQGNIQKALEHLETAEKFCLDRLAVLELRALYSAKLGRKEQSLKAYRALLDRNSEYRKYYDALVEVMKIDLSDHKARKAVYDEYATKYPRCDAAARLPLDFLEGDDFKLAANQYIHRMLNKGVPSTFANLKHLYTNTFKKDTLANLVKSYVVKNEDLMNAETDEKINILPRLAAAYYFLSQHFNYRLSRNLETASEYIEKAIQIEPQSVDFHMTKARIWKYYGNRRKASELMEQARLLDTRDRHINTKAAKYQLRNNETEKALKTLGLFTRAESTEGPLADLHDMQCMWFLIEDGESYARQGKIGLALKRFTSIYHIYDVWQEDQFDFHSFSLRKGQIRAYVDMIKWEDRLREHPFFLRAALSAIKIYIKMHDMLEAPLMNGINDQTDGHNDALEKKKAAKKARKESARVDREAAIKKTEPNKPLPVRSDATKKKDDDPDGAKLAASTEPAKDAIKFLLPLLQFRPQNIHVQIAGFELYIRRKKYLLALKCLLAAISLDEKYPQVHELIIRFKLNVDKNIDSLSPEVADVVKSEFNYLPSSVNLKEYNEKYLSENKDNPRKIISGLKIRKLLDPESASRCEKDMLKILNLTGSTLEEALEGLETLKMWKCAELDSYRSEAAKKWPKSSAFD
ncbi:N-alpha-acetyltransferase 15, NatA auxiliary subunit [Podosphaera aphanis]|nr:N-alpha-acetyltransferase 15, NatA auxiliary subunit [Podosphaera aphanis]